MSGAELFLDLELELALLCAGSVLAVLPWVDAQSRGGRKAVFYVFTLLAARYAVWRVTRTMPVPSLSLAALGAYAYGAFELWLLWMSFKAFRMYPRFRLRSREADENARWFERLPEPPLVDVLIPTYDEDERVLRRAVVAALAQSYSSVRVWVLDDGRRKWVRQLTEGLGARYLTRPDNAGYKAGNLNNALQRIGELPNPSDFVAVLDCDFVAKPSFVARTLALMHDGQTAIVQTKQVYFNADPFQRALRLERALPDFQRFVFDVLGPCKEAFGGSTCCGTAFLARRASLEAIGGIPTESVTEDTLTTLALNRLGLRTVYLDEALAYGVVAEGMNEFVTQVGRWCLGNVQLIHSRLAGASPEKSRRERWRFIQGSLHWAIFSVAKLVQLWLPVLYWFGGPDIFPVRAENGEFITFFLPFWVFTSLAQTWLTRGTNLPVIADARVLSWAPAVLKATCRGLWGRPDQRFVVTPKGAVRERTTYHVHLLAWHAPALVLTAAGLIYGAAFPHDAKFLSYDAFAYFWSVYNLLCLVVAIAVCVEPAERRRQVRFASGERAELSSQGVRWSTSVVDISASGARVRTDAPITRGATIVLKLAGVDALEARVTRREGNSVALSFVPDPDRERELVRKLFSDDYVKPVMRANAWAVTCGVLRKAFL